MGSGMNILVNGYPHYDYLIATVSQGLSELGHNVYCVQGEHNYCMPHNGEACELSVQCIPGEGPRRDVRSVMLWGRDNHIGLEQEFNLGFAKVFVRDRNGEPGVPIHFGAETRYFCATENGIKPLKDREIDICFLGQLYENRGLYLKRLREDFAGYNLVLGPRKFSNPDDYWSKWTLPWAAHDPKYFETLANSKVVLSFRGFGPDCGRHYEVMASGGFPAIQSLEVDMVRPKPKAGWFIEYRDLACKIRKVLAEPEAYQDFVNEAWEFNRHHHSTTARAAYFLKELGYECN